MQRILSDIKQRGISKPSLFKVRIENPSALKINTSNNLANDIGNFASKLVNRRFLDLSCETATLPGRTWTKDEPIFSQGPPKPMPGKQVFSEIKMTFRLSANCEEKKFFDDWQNSMMDPFTFEYNYYDEYVTQIEIIQLKNNTPFFGLLGSGRFVGEIADEFTGLNEAYTVKLIGAFPIGVDELTLDHAANNQYHKMSVTFAFQHWIAGGFKPPVTDNDFLNTALNTLNDFNPLQSNPF